MSSGRREFVVGEVGGAVEMISECHHRCKLIWPCELHGPHLTLQRSALAEFLHIDSRRSGGGVVAVSHVELHQVAQQRRKVRDAWTSHLSNCITECTPVIVRAKGSNKGRVREGEFGGERKPRFRERHHRRELQSCKETHHRCMVVQREACSDELHEPR